MAWLMVKVGARDRGHELDEEVVFVGTAEDSQVRLSGDGIAPRHCQVLRTAKGFRLVDLGGGIAVNGKPVNQADLHDGDMVQVGVVSMTFRSESQALRANSQSEPAPPAVPAVVKSSRAGGAVPARSSTARRSSARGNRRDDDDDDDRRGGYRRKQQGIPTPVLVLTIFSALAVVVFILFKTLGGSGETFEGCIARAETYAQQDNYQAALQMVDRAEKLIGGRQAGTQLKSLESRRTEYKSKLGVTETLFDAKDESIWYNNVIVPFFELYVDETNPKFKGKEYVNDPATARYFVEHRLKPYTEKFANGPNIGQVRSWIASLSTRYNAADPFPDPTKWWDTSVIQYHETYWDHYGYAYSLIKKFQLANPTYKPPAIQEQLDQVHELAAGYLNGIKLRIAEGLTGKNYSMALGRAIRAIENLKGIDDLAQLAYEEAQKIKARAAENKITLTTEIPQPK